MSDAINFDPMNRGKIAICQRGVYAFRLGDATPPPTSTRAIAYLCADDTISAVALPNRVAVGLFLLPEDTPEPAPAGHVWVGLSALPESHAPLPRLVDLDDDFLRVEWGKDVPPGETPGS